LEVSRFEFEVGAAEIVRWGLSKFPVARFQIPEAVTRDGPSLWTLAMDDR